MHRTDRSALLPASMPYWTAEVVSWLALLLLAVLVVLLSTGVAR
jgi:hypothetical protein